jgi:ArsR family transcriptional regulator, virulence genes transcriptional regulator
MVPMTDLAGEFADLHAHICKGLADPKRLLILNALRDGERSVSDLVEELKLAQANVSQHLAVLRDRGLVETRREGQRVFYSVSSDKIILAMDLLREVMHMQAEKQPGLLTQTG